jgi:hypothetical protein
VVAAIAIGFGLLCALALSCAMMSLILRRTPLWWLPGGAWQFAGIATIAGMPNHVANVWILILIGVLLFALGTASIVVVRRLRAAEPIPKATARSHGS